MSFIKYIIKKIIHLPRILSSNDRALPDFLIVGAQKAGTTSLFDYLNKHPQTDLSIIKEVHYFDINFNKSVNWYKSYFPKKKSNYKITGEATPYYLYHPLVPMRVAKLLPQIKLIILLRDPINRAYSQYKMEVRKGRESLNNFIDAIDNEAERLHTEKEKIHSNPYYYSIEHQAHSYLDRGLYYVQVKRWLKYFNKKQILVINSESFFCDPKKELSKVYKFLGIDVVFPNELRPSNVGGGKNIEPKVKNYLSDFFKNDQKKLNQLLKEKGFYEYFN